MWKMSGSAVVALALLAGCDEGLTLVPVSGKVTVDGKPLAYKSLMFIPDAETPGVGGGGNTQKDGSYTVLAALPGATSDHEGLPPGRYKVIVFEPQIPITGDGDLAVQSSDSDEVVAAVIPGMRPRKREIPRIYTRQETTPLVLEVPDDGAVLNLELFSTGRS